MEFAGRLWCAHCLEKTVHIVVQSSSDGAASVLACDACDTEIRPSRREWDPATGAILPVPRSEAAIPAETVKAAKAAHIDELATMAIRTGARVEELPPAARRNLP